MLAGHGRHTLRQLAAYAAVARAASFTAAAAELHVSQSSLSRAVADLERLLGVQLLERDTRNVQLTAAGVEALRIAEQIVAAHRAGMKELQALPARRVGHGRRGHPALGRGGAAAAGDLRLPRAASAGGGTAPGRAGTARYSTGSCPATPTSRSPPSATPPDQLEHRPLVRDRFDAVLPEEHPLAERDEVTWEDLAAEPFLAVGPGLERPPAHRRGVRPVDAPGRRPAAEAGNVATVGGLVAAGLGVSAMPALVLPLMGAGPRRPPPAGRTRGATGAWTWCSGPGAPYRWRRSASWRRSRSSGWTERQLPEGVSWA